MDDSRQRDALKRSLLVVVILAAMGAAIWIVPLLERRREPHSQTRSASNLNQIGKALQMYADAPENNGSLPVAINALYPKYIADRNVFLNPRAEAYRDNVAMQRASTTGVSIVGYAYEPDLDINDAAVIVAYEKVPVGGGRNVLVMGGSVEFVEEPEFQKRLIEQRARLATKTSPSPNPAAP